MARLAGLAIAEFDPHHRANIFDTREVNVIRREAQRPDEIGHRRADEQEANVIVPLIDNEDQNKPDPKPDQ